jgi:hypothetical protein
MWGQKLPCALAHHVVLKSQIGQLNSKNSLKFNCKSQPCRENIPKRQQWSKCNEQEWSRWCGSDGLRQIGIWYWHRYPHRKQYMNERRPCPERRLSHLRAVPKWETWILEVRIRNYNKTYGSVKSGALSSCPGTQTCKNTVFFFTSAIDGWSTKRTNDLSKDNGNRHLKREFKSF